MRHGSTLDVLPRACRAAGFEPNILFRTDDQITVRGLVAAGLGIAMVPWLVVSTVPPGLVVRPLDEPALTRTVMTASPSARPLATTTAMIGALETAAGELGAKRRAEQRRYLTRVTKRGDRPPSRYVAMPSPASTRWARGKRCVHIARQVLNLINDGSGLRDLAVQDASAVDVHVLRALARPVVADDAKIALGGHLIDTAGRAGQIHRAKVPTEGAFGARYALVDRPVKRRYCPIVHSGQSNWPRESMPFSWLRVSPARALIRSRLRRGRG